MVGAIDPNTHYTQSGGTAPCLSVCLSADLVFFVSALSSFDHTPAQRAEFSCPAMRCSSTEFFRLMFSLFFWNQFADIIETDTHGARRPWSTHILTASGQCLTSAAAAFNKPSTASYRRCRCYCNLWPRWKNRQINELHWESGNAVLPLDSKSHFLSLHATLWIISLIELLLYSCCCCGIDSTADGPLRPFRDWVTSMMCCVVSCFWQQRK